ncbi:MAG: sulfotransferase family 2 domain-containing protein [Coleofasciculus chthonoplastes F3-SA18-01]|uniref:sulfotransferase family 2 domain-containing protein n=1 Tax=Coleofasciculus chthonoplastes TaxID=64178 RepID=UPI0032FC2021
MNELIVFTHIPKTAGSFLQKKFIEANVPPNRCYTTAGLKEFILKSSDNYQLFYGHLPYGVHLLTPRSVRYITLLREPIDRAISFYYSMKEVDIKIYKHPFREYADSLTLKDFYKNRNLQNVQTRFIAGVLSDKLYPKLPSQYMDNLILYLAQKNLVNYIYGISDRLDESIELFTKKLSWTYPIDMIPYRKTRNRPTKDDLDQETIQVLLKANVLDMKLYEFALNNFNKQFMNV